MLSSLKERFRLSKNFVAVDTLDGEVATNGFSQISKRPFTRGTLFELIGGRLTKSGVCFYKGEGVSAPIKFSNSYRFEKQLSKCLVLESTTSGKFSCGTPYSKYTRMFLLGGKSKSLRVISFNNGVQYSLEVEPTKLSSLFRFTETSTSDLTKTERVFKNNLHSEYMDRHFGKTGQR